MTLSCPLVPQTFFSQYCLTRERLIVNNQELLKFQLLFYFHIIAARFSHFQLDDLTSRYFQIKNELVGTRCLFILENRIHVYLNNPDQGEEAEEVDHWTVHVMCEEREERVKC